MRSVNGPRPEINIQELKNAEKQLYTVESEYERINARFGQVTDPQYVLDIKERILSYSEKIKKLEKHRKKMETDQFHREKQMKKVIDTGELEIAQHINAAKTDRLIVEGKLQEAENTISNGTSSLQNQEKKLEDLKALYQKQLKECETNKIDIKKLLGENKSNNTQKENDEKKLSQKKQSLIKEISLLKTRYNFTIGDFTQKRLTLQKQIEKTYEGIQKKDEYFIYNLFMNSI